MTATERFWSKVDRAEGCWLWRGATLRSGYGHFSLHKTSTTAHRFAYQLLVGPIPFGMHLDHLCRIRNCVNPDHLEPVTPSENSRRSWAAVRRGAGSKYSAGDNDRRRREIDRRNCIADAAQAAWPTESDAA